MDTVYSLEVWVPDGEQWRWSAIGAYPTLDMAVAVGEGFLSVKPYRVRVGGGRQRGLTARPIYADTAPRVRPAKLRDGKEKQRVEGR